ncbi:MAG: DUF6174 domain-containing protein [Gemmatimonadaceae bacterium]
MQAGWQARGIATYRYDFDQGGFFNACPRPVRVYVGAGVMDSAVVIATGDPLSATMAQACAPTIDGLFATAEGTASNGTLESIRYDARYHYPTEVRISGPPDAAGFLAASGLQPQ